MTENKINTEKLIRSNYEFEQDIAESFEQERKALDDYLEFVFEHKKNELTINRVIRLEASNTDKTLPHDWYLKGIERGTKKKGYFQGINGLNYSGDYFSVTDANELSWVEWIVTSENTETVSDTFSITITPFLLDITTKNNNTAKKHTKQEYLSLYSDTFYSKWNTKLEEIFIEKKRLKVNTIISDSYKILGLDRQAKIKSILKEE